MILFNKQKVVKQGVPHRRHQQSHANNVKVEHTKTYSCRYIRSRLINHDSCSCRLCSLYFWFKGYKIQGVPKRSFFSVRTPCIKLKSYWHLPAKNISMWWLFQIICKENCKYEVNSPDSAATRVLPLEKQEKPRRNICGENYIKVDRLFLILSPILFLIFNCIYWLSYCSHYIIEALD